MQVELAWAAHKMAQLKFLRSLNLPSWAWIAYKGRIRFTKEDRQLRDPRRVRLPPMAEIQLVEADVPDMITPLSLAKPASLTVDITVRKLHGISTEITEYGKHAKTREELAASSPFHFDPRTVTTPIPLSERSECRVILDSDQKVIGFFSFDEDMRHTGDMFCAHISALSNEADFEARRKFDDSEVQSVDMREFQTPILAYALVLVKMDATENEYKRVGLAEVNHGWMTSGTRERVSLV